MRENNFSLNSTLKGNSAFAELPFRDIKNEVLGKDYDLSLVLIGDKFSRKLNREFKGKDKSTNVLSFPLSPTEGEVYINVRQAEREALKFHKNSKQFLGYLFIHGVLHLKGMAHGSRMESKERILMKKFGLA